MMYKACPKCHGDVYRQTWPDLTVDISCLQCGRILTQPEVQAMSQRVMASKRTPAMATAA